MPPADDVRDESCAEARRSPAAFSRLNSLFRKLFFLIPIGIIGNVIALAITTDRAQLRSLLQIKPGYFLLAMVFGVIPWFTGSLRMHLWTKFLGNNLGYRTLFRIAVCAELGGAISPPLVGGGPVKLGMLMQRGFSAGTALSIVTMENLEDALFFCIMVPVALTVSSSWQLPVVRSVLEQLGQAPFLLTAAGAAVTLFAVCFAIMKNRHLLKQRFLWFHSFSGKLRTFVENFSGTFKKIIRSGKAVLILTLTLTALQWICKYTIISLVLLSFGLQPHPLLFMALQVLVFAFASLIPTPGGVGGAETVFYFIHRAYLPAGLVYVITAVWRFFTFYFLALLGSLLFLLFKAHSATRTSPTAIRGGSCEG
jgi:uncharacterized protein (TIRG00374 family)